MASSSSKPRCRMHTVWASSKRNTTVMLSEIRDFADQRMIVQIVRPGARAFQIIKNGGCYLTRSATGDALATSGTLLEAVMAGDRHLDFLPRVDGDDFPRGAA